MAENYVLLETIELSQTAASVTFDNIPQTGYTDLKIVASVRSDYSGQAIALRINPNGSTANMTSQNLQGSGSAVSAFTDTIAYASANGNTSTANTFNNAEWYIPNYTSSNAKSISVDYVTETNAAAAIMGFSGGLWNPGTQVAITSLVIITTSGNLMAGSTFSIFGVAATGTTPVTAPFASGGNIVANDGTYWYHAFLSSGTFTPLKALSCDLLLVGGGGAGGGGPASGGGGAGGVIAFASQALLATPVTVTVGAGGVANANGNLGGTAGSSTTFGALTAAYGGSPSATTTGGPYGSIGGGGANGGGTNEPSVSPTQGNNGGTASFSGSGNSRRYSGGGGGGFGSAGSAASVGNGGAGGAGANTVTNWGALSAALTATNTGVSGYIAGGGGGGYGAEPSGGAGNYGAGGSGGAGRGGNSGSNGGVSGTANTGSGGGGNGFDSSAYAMGGNGGSGIVIVRYTMV